MPLETINKILKTLYPNLSLEIKKLSKTHYEIEDNVNSLNGLNSIPIHLFIKVIINTKNFFSLDMLGINRGVGRNNWIKSCNINFEKNDSYSKFLLFFNKTLENILNPDIKEEKLDISEMSLIINEKPIQRIMILGGGFIGYNLAIGFHESEYQVTLVDKKHFNENKYFKAYQLNIKNGLDKIFQKESPDVIYYMIDDSFYKRTDDQLLYYMHLDNYNFLKVLSLALKHGVKKIILASNFEISHDDCDSCLNLNKYKLSSLLPQDINKFSNELYLQYFKEKHNIDFVSLRFAQVYGYKESNFWSDNLIDSLITGSLKKKTIKIDQHEDDSTNLIYIGDTISALIFSLRNEISGIYNVTDKYYPFKDIINAVEGKINKKTDVLFDNGKNLKKQKNNFRLNHLTFHGWKPIVSLESGINVVYNQIIRKSDFI
jgi:UDP-glucose 4-epimerase